jgi:ketosteroid isomerase-like protein
MSEENVDVVRRAIDAYNRRDLQAMKAEAHSDVEVDWSASRGLEAGVYRGFEETDAFYENWFDMFETRLEPERLIESGDRVLVPNTAVTRGGTASKPWREVALSTSFVAAGSRGFVFIRRRGTPSKPPGLRSRSPVFWSSEHHSLCHCAAQNLATRSHRWGHGVSVDPDGARSRPAWSERSSR